MTNELMDKLKQALEENAEPDIKTKPTEQTRHKKVIGSILATLCFGCFIYFCAPLWGDSSQGTSKGELSSPTQWETTGRNVDVAGYTQDLVSGCDYVWLVVDKPDIELCWPKGSVLAPNTHFKTQIFEGGPEGKYVLSLYAVNLSRHEEFLAWIAKKRLGGIPMVPKRFKLDSKVLMVADRD